MNLKVNIRALKSFRIEMLTKLDFTIFPLSTNCAH